MKKTLLIMVMALALLLTQCRKPEVKFPSPVAPEGTTVSMTVTAGPGSKTDITPAGGITWSTGDKLYVGDGSKYVGYLTLVSGADTPTGTFSGDVTLTDITEGTEKTFGFYYLGSAERTLTVGATTANVDFSSQEICNNGGKLKNASAQHVGYGSAKGTVTDGVVTGINVTLVSKVALARFSFTEAAGKGEYSGPLALSGTHIYSSMTVYFNSSTGFSFSGTEGAISLRGSHSERYVMLVPAGTDSKTLNFVGGAKGTTILENGIEANKFYGRESAIGVEVTPQEYVDLGLSVKWATCNLGASKPEEYGDYYAWGATETWYSAGGQSGSPTWKDGYSDGYTWAHCPFTNGTFDIDNNKKVFTKYIPTGKSEYWAGGDNPDNKLVLESSDDAATANWGSAWRMPTETELNELINNTTRTWYAKGSAEFNGVAGWKCANKSDATKYIFLPAAGSRSGNNLNLAGSSGSYWSSSLITSDPYNGRNLRFTSTTFNKLYNTRLCGFTVRPVR